MHDIRHTAAQTLMTGNGADPDTRVLRRVSRLDDLPLAPRGDGPIRRVAVVDTETTGTDPLTDEIIDVAVVILEVDAVGEIVGIASAGQALRDPGVSIPPHITRITGITDDDVRGRAIDLDVLERRLASAEVRIAHLAAFDIGFLENLMPGLASAAWACSARDFDWVAAGLDGCKLGHLLMQIGRFSDAHRAMTDVVALVHLLAHRLPHGGTVLGDLLANAAWSTLRIEATNSAYEKRSALKSRGYRWDPRAKTWWTEIDPAELDEEAAWLGREAGVWGTPRTRPVTWHERHR